VLVRVDQSTSAWVWSVRAPLRGTDDPRLWNAIPYCMSVEQRVVLLSEPEARARADQDACEHRVQAATRPFAGGP
jgi:hypothetical protein